MRRGRHLAMAISALALSMGAPRRAASDAMPPAAPGWYVPVGINLGGSLHHDVPGGFLLGGEVSVVNRNQASQAVWVGGYADGLWDFGADHARISIGPEIGYGPLGFDLGYVAAVGRDDGYHHGIAGRGVVTLSLVAFYVRVGKIFDIEEEAYGEIGALIKLPLPLYTERGDPRPPHLEPSPVHDAGVASPVVEERPPAGVATDPPPTQQFAEPP
jgi:hypothetical protein